MDIRIYVANLAKYNEGELVGQWIDLPCEDLDEKIEEILGDDEEFAIHDYEAPFKIGEYEDIYKLNNLAEELENSEEDEEVIEAIFEFYSYDKEKAIKVLTDRDYRIYHNCHSMADVAEEHLEETGMLNELPNWASNYFDFEAYGRDMEIEGNFEDLGNGSYIEFIG